MTTQRLTMSKILITGASGLLGTEFCHQLKAAGHEVWALDNHSRSSSIPPCDSWHKMDLLAKDSFAGFNTLPHDFDYIYHYGAMYCITKCRTENDARFINFC